MFANATPFASLAVPLHDERGADTVVVLVKATYVKSGTKLAPADEQIPVRTNDVPADARAVDEGRPSSIRYPSDVGGNKPGTDVVVVGDAVSRRRVERLDVAVRFPDRVVALRVHGERFFHKGTFGMSIGPAVAFERVSTAYERAYGGSSRDRSIVEWRNPVGRGVHGSPGELDGALAPCIEDPAHPIDGARKAAPVGFGAIPMWWQPRRDFVGTADEAWRSRRMPLLPRDFDRRFHQVAHPSLQMDRMLRAGDLIGTEGIGVDGTFFAAVPELPIVAHVRRSTGLAETVPLAIDTALVEPEHARVELTLRRVLLLGRGKTLLREVRVDVA
jgi:hypothetical protein